MSLCDTLQYLGVNVACNCHRCCSRNLDFAVVSGRYVFSIFPSCRHSSKSRRSLRGIVPSFSCVLKTKITNFLTKIVTYPKSPCKSLLLESHFTSTRAESLRTNIQHFKSNLQNLKEHSARSCKTFHVTRTQHSTRRCKTFHLMTTYQQT